MSTLTLIESTTPQTTMITPAKEVDCVSEPSGRFYRIALVAIFVCALTIRVALTAAFVGLNEAPDRRDGLDQMDYEGIAWSLAQGQGYTLEDKATARRPPGTSLILAPVYLVLGHSYIAGHLWFNLISAVTCPVAAWAVRPRLGSAMSLVVAAALAFDPAMIYYSIHFWSEPPFCLFLTLAIGFTLRALPSADVPIRFLPVTTIILGGIFWGFSILVRPQLALMIPILGVIMFCSRSVRKMVQPIALIQCFVIAACLAPWLARNLVVIGKLTMATQVGGFTFAGAHNEITFADPAERGSWIVVSRVIDPAITAPMSELESERYAWNFGIQAVRQHWAEMPRLLAAKVFRLVTPWEETTNKKIYWAFAISWLLLIPFVLIGFRTLRKTDGPLFTMISLLVTVTLVTTLVFYGSTRFRHSIEPVLVILGVAGLQQSGRYFSSIFTSSLKP